MLLIATNAEIRRVVFTDLDGTLLDHDTYEWRPAASTLQRLKALDVPIVLVSSKTLSELDRHRRALAVHGPVIAENGAVIDTPGGYFLHGGVGDGGAVPDRATLQRHFREIRDLGNFDCTSFEELGVSGIAAATGLTYEEARLANERQASEPVQWRESDGRFEEFAAAAAARGLRCTRGGRFVHLMGQVDKADAVGRLCDAYGAEWPDAVVESIALGDGPNDLGMLQSTDVAVVIPGRHGKPMRLDGKNRVILAAQPGPAGWAAAMEQLISAW